MTKEKIRLPKPINIKKIKKTQEVKDLRPLSDKEFELFRETIRTFVTKLSNEFPPDYLTNLYNNLHTLRIKNKKTFLIKIGGAYSPRTNSIIIIDDESIYHELMHMASTSSDRRHNGFSYKSMGNGLNEGYTELLTARLFNNGRINAYQVETKIAAIIEKVIGPKTTKLYFTANLKGLIEELKNYTSENEISQFIANLDLYNFLNDDFEHRNYDKAVYLIHEIYNYITKLYFLYLKKQLTEETISKEEYFASQEQFLKDNEMIKFHGTWCPTYTSAFVNNLKEELNQSLSM